MQHVVQGLPHARGLAHNLLNQKPHPIHFPLERQLQGRVVLLPTPRFDFDLHCLKKEVWVVIFKFWDCTAVFIARGLAQKKAQKIYSFYHCDVFSSDSACAQPSLKQGVPKLSLSH